MTYQQTLKRIGAHEAAMLVKWLMAPARSHAANVATDAHSIGLFHRVKGLTDSGKAFAIEHMAREFERLSGMQISTQRKRFDVRCPSCGWIGRRTKKERDGFGWCRCGIVLERRTRKTSCIDPDCGQTEGHAESCGLSFGDEFAQRADEVGIP